MAKTIDPDDLRSVLLGWGLPCTCPEGSSNSFDCIKCRMDEFIADCEAGECQ